MLLLFIQARLIESYVIVNEILDRPNPSTVAIFGIAGLVATLMNSMVIAYIFKKTKNYVLVPSILLLILGTYHKFVGLRNSDKHVVIILVGLLICTIAGIFFVYILSALDNINYEQQTKVTKIIEEDHLK